MLPFPFQVERPKTLAAAIDALREAGEQEIQVIAGGTDLIPRLRQGRRRPRKLVDISLLVPELSHIGREGEDLCMGALTTHDQLSRSPLVQQHAPVLAQACRVVGSQQIRNRGTLGGNLANASPAGDTLPPLLALNAKLRLAGNRGKRVLPLAEFLLGPGQTRLDPSELITEIIIPAASLNARGVYKKLGLRNALTIAVASVAVVEDTSGNWRLAYGAVAPRPVRARELERAINEEGVREWDELKQLVDRAIRPVTDVRASAAYRREMAANLTYMALYELQLLH